MTEQQPLDVIVDRLLAAAALATAAALGQAGVKLDKKSMVQRTLVVEAVHRVATARLRREIRSLLARWKRIEQAQGSAELRRQAASDVRTFGQAVAAEATAKLLVNPQFMGSLEALQGLPPKPPGGIVH